MKLTTLLPRLLRQSVPFFRVLIEMSSHDTQLQCLFSIVQIVIALSQHRPGRPSTRLYTNDLQHDAQGLWYVVVDIRLVSFADQSFDLLGQNHPLLPARLQLVSRYSRTHGTMTRTLRPLRFPTPDASRRSSLNSASLSPLMSKSHTLFSPADPEVSPSRISRTSRLEAVSVPKATVY